MKAEHAKREIEKLKLGLEAIDSNVKLLADLGWSREVEEQFFARGCRSLPEPEYLIDRQALHREVASLRALSSAIEGEGEIRAWLQSILGSYIDRARLLLACGTPEFGKLSVDVYGGAQSVFAGLEKTNIELARHLQERLTMHGWDAAHDTEDELLDAHRLAAFLEERIARRKIPVKVILDPKCTSKVIAGSKRVRVRPDATFTAWEAEGLYRHEIETHVYSALNGAAQVAVPFLKSGGPRSTRTQEGLAVFAELYHRALAVPRLSRLALRVEMVDMAEKGASFLDVFRFLVRDKGVAEREAYLDASRIFRGAPLEGGAPFTKDACYLAGLVEVHTFLGTFVRAGFRDECEMLLSGRFALEDLDALVELRALGILERPRLRPRWLREWGTLLPFFAFTSFIDGIDRAQLEKKYARALEVASQAAPRHQ
jgi:uncharacterized protein (TIGR02421 family)